MKQFKLLSGMASLAVLLLMVVSCQNQATITGLDDKPIVGFSQVGANIRPQDGVRVAQQGVVVKVNASHSQDKIREVILALKDGKTFNPDQNAPYEFVVDFPRQGDNVLVAKAVDEQGRSSDEVNLVVNVAEDSGSGTNVTLPVVTWTKPEASLVNGLVNLEVSATDPNDPSSSSDDGTIEKVDFYAGSIFLGSAYQATLSEWRLSWNTLGVNDTLPNGFLDGKYTLIALATDDAGNIGSALLDITVDNSGNIPDPPQASIDLAEIEPRPSLHASCTANAETPENGCYSGTISIPVRVNDETGDAKVRLLVKSRALGTFPLADIITVAPYTFTLNTLNFPNNDILTFVPEITNSAGTGGTESQAIAIYNDAPPPVLSINSPSSGQVLSGIMPVSLSINQLTDSRYTLDLNSNGRVDHTESSEGFTEGFHIEVIDFTGEVIMEQRFSSDALPAPLKAESSGSYETPMGFDTTQIANDTYTLRITLNARLKDDLSVEPVSLIRYVSIDTSNTNRVPPSVLVLSPKNYPDANGNMVIQSLSDSGNVFAVVQVTDNTGVVHVEARVFSGNSDDDHTPSRFIKAYPEPVIQGSVALPLNYNAHPYLADGNNYSIRIIAEDVDGNRTFQDVKIRLERKPANDSYQLESINTTDGQPVYQVLKNEAFIIRAPNLNGAEVIQLYKGPTDSTYSPIAYQQAFSVGFSEGGVHSFIAQVITPDGEIYTTNQVGVSVIAN
ncbi:MAG: Ig-like domain-containing protein [Deinococcales bacterium]